MKSVSDDRNHEFSGEEVFLITAANEREYDVYKSLLEAYGIPVLKKPREAGGYLNISMGMNVYGADIYVPEKYYKDAVELVKDAADKVSDDNDKELETINEQYQNKRFTYVWIIIALFYFPFLIWLIYTLIDNYI